MIKSFSQKLKNIFSTTVDEEFFENIEDLLVESDLGAVLAIEVVEKKEFIELKFLKMEEEFDESIFNADELKTIYKVVSEHKDSSARNVANATFKIDEVRITEKGEIII